MIEIQISFKISSAKLKLSKAKNGGKFRLKHEFKRNLIKLISITRSVAILTQVVESEPSVQRKFDSRVVVEKEKKKEICKLKSKKPGLGIRIPNLQ